jgi:hypothetical protein
MTLAERESESRVTYTQSNSVKINILQRLFGSSSLGRLLQTIFSLHFIHKIKL